MLIDTGADATLLPSNAVDQLEIPVEDSEFEVQVFDGEIKLRSGGKFMRKITLLLLLLITACTPKGATISIFENSKCNLPCWNAITPGKTSQAEALQVLKDLDGVDQKSIVGPSLPREIFSGIIFFRFI
jgi:hypothetical protein